MSKSLEERQRETARVVCAANKLHDGRILVGARHWDEHMVEQAKTLEEAGVLVRAGQEIQGFIDQYGNFLTRQEALEIAKRQGQIFRRCGGDKHELFSENLY